MTLSDNSAKNSYQSSIEHVDEVTRKLSVSIPVERVTAELSSAIADASRNVKLKGFRPGKAPKDLVEKMHGQRLRWEVANRLISSSLVEAVREHKLEVVGSPEIDLASFEEGKSIEFTASISIFPQPKIDKYESFTLKIPKVEVKEEDIQEVLTQMQERKATTRKLEFRETVQKGDVIDASVSVEIEGGEKSRPEPVTLPIGVGQLQAELDEGIVGMKIGETKEFVLTTPEDHRDQAMRGKKATYVVTLNGLSEKILPELTDDFAKSLQFGVETLLELRLKVRSQLEEESKKRSQADIHAAILDQLIENNPFKVPQILVDEEIRILLARNGILDLSKKEHKELPVDKFRDKLGEAAEKRVKSAIIIDTISKAQEIKPTEEDVDREIDSMASESQMSRKDVEDYLAKSHLLGSIRHDIQRNKTLDFLAERAKVEYLDSKS
jgi:trigger factor